MTDVAIRRATRADLDLVVDILTDAFTDDPSINYLLPPGSDRERRRRHRAAQEADVRWEYFPVGEVLVTEDELGALLWKPRGARNPSAWQQARSGLAYARAVGPLRAVRPRRDLEAAEKKHPTSPHGYIGELGVRREAQGKGVGSALMRHALAACDADGAGAYLESNSVANLPLYRRFGFEVVDEVTMGKNGPRI